jgi:antitoxin CptB
MDETAEARLKRMRMRSWRRGTKEMDLVLGPYADAHLAENDQDLMAWILGQSAPPPAISGLLGRIAGFAESRLRRKN